MAFIRTFPCTGCGAKLSFAPGTRTLKAVDVMITAGALSAIYGIVQYGILDFDNLGQRVQGTLGHYMTYSGVIMLVGCVAAARVMFRAQDRLWAALIMPARVCTCTEYSPGATPLSVNWPSLLVRDVPPGMNCIASFMVGIIMTIAPAMGLPSEVG